MVEFASANEANAGREKLLASGVLDQFEDKTDPKVLEEAEHVSYEPTDRRTDGVRRRRAPDPAAR
jgi:hypothetical protein